MNKKRVGEKTKDKKEKVTAPQKLKLLVTIVERNKADFYIDVIEDYEVTLQTIIYGKGTMKSSASHLLGLDSPEKAIILSVVREEKIPHLLGTLNEKFTRIKNGNGIAYTISLTSVIGVMIYQFLSNNQMNIKRGNE